MMRTEYHKTDISQETQRTSIPERGSLRATVSLNRASEVGGGCLPCLFSNISIGESTEEAIVGLTSLLSPYHKKAAQTLYLNVSRLLLEAESLGHVGFLTLTFKENVTDNAEASRRFDIFNTNFLLKDPRFGVKIAVKEPQKRGAWHYHILIVLTEDIRSGVDFEALKNRDYKTASPYLKQLWRDIRAAADLYGFGRTELIPVKSNSEAMGRYIGKYISKGMEQRNPDHKGVRLVNYSKGWLRNSPKFAWNTTNSAEWRRKVSLFAKTNGCSDLYQLSEKFGSDWAYRFIDQVIDAQEHWIEDRERWEYQPDESRISKETGETQSPETYLYQDRKIKTALDNQNKRFHHMWADARGELNGRSTYRQEEKKRRKKEQEKSHIQIAILKAQIFGSTSTQHYPEDLDEKGRFRRSTPEEHTQREEKVSERLRQRKENREQEKIELREMIQDHETEQEWLRGLPEAPF